MQLLARLAYRCWMWNLREISSNQKISAFCRELGDSVLREIAVRENMETVFRRAEESLKAGQIGSRLEADLDLLDGMVRRVEGQGLYPEPTRSYSPLPGPGSGAGAQWWTCPRRQCAGSARAAGGYGLARSRRSARPPVSS
jgi:hypothetical protein